MYFNYSIDPFIAVAKPENEDDITIKKDREDVKEKLHHKFGYYQYRLGFSESVGTSDLKLRDQKMPLVKSLHVNMRHIYFIDM